MSADGDLAGCASTWPGPLLHDTEGPHVPDGIRVFDAHVHLFPDRLFEAIWRWFDAHAWPVRYRLHAEQVVEFLVGHGVARFCGLAYSHRPGMSRDLNRFMTETARAHSQIVPLGTVLPGEPDAEEIVREALGPLGLRGLKLHCHVQQIAADDPRIDPIYAASAAHGTPVLIHAGREPSFPGYPIDVKAICAAERVARVLERHPRLVLVIPHLGMDEYDDYARLTHGCDRLHLDTTMAIARYFEQRPSSDVFPGCAARLHYGTDFPNLPFAWDRELKRILAEIPAGPIRDAILWDNAARLFGT